MHIGNRTSLERCNPCAAKGPLALPGTQSAPSTALLRQGSDRRSWAVISGHSRPALWQHRAQRFQSTTEGSSNPTHKQMSSWQGAHTKPVLCRSSVTGGARLYPAHTFNLH